MFVEINGSNVNMYSIATFKGIDKKIENSDGTNTYVDVYTILYVTTGGSTLEEVFQDKSARDTKLNVLKEKFVTVTNS